MYSAVNHIIFLGASDITLLLKPKYVQRYYIMPPTGWFVVCFKHLATIYLTNLSLSSNQYNVSYNDLILPDLCLKY